MKTRWRNFRLLSFFVLSCLALSVHDIAQAKRKHSRSKQKAKTSLTLLLRLGTPSPANWEADLISAAKAATAERSTLLWRDPPQVSLEETRTLLGCRTWDTSCVGQIGATLGVGRVFYIDLSDKDSKAPVLRIIDVDVSDPAKATTTTLKIPDRNVMGLTLAQAYLRAAVLEKQLTTLVVSSEPERAEVLIDGAVVGRTPLLQLANFRPGAHKIILRQPGFKSFSQSLDAEKGQISLVKAKLLPLQEATTPTPPAPIKEPPTKVLIAKQDPGPTVDTDNAGPAWNTVAGLSAIGLGSALLLGGGASYAGYRSLSAAMNDVTPDPDNENLLLSSMTQDEYDSASKTRDLLYPSSLVLSGLGLVSVAAGAVLMVVVPSSSEPGETPSADVATEPSSSASVSKQP